MKTNKTTQVTIYSPNHSITSTTIGKKFRYGKLYTGPISNAFNRKTLGSIPTSIENVLFQNKHGDIIRFSFNINESNSKNENYKLNDSLNKKIQNKKDISPRFNYSQIDDQKYYPGPGQYQSDYLTTENNLNDNNNFRYNNIFSFGRENIPINKKGNDDNVIIGPGRYNLDYNKKTEKNVYISQDERFKKYKQDEYKKKIGPGTYDINLSIGEKYKNNNISSFFQTEISESKIKKEDNSPGPGSYNLRTNFIKKRNNFNIFTKYKSISEYKNDIKKSILNNTNLSIDYEKNNKNEEYYYINNDDDDNQQNVKGFSMERKIPRFFYPGQKKEINPGPCYYNPKKQSKRYEFNSNDENKWI